MASPPHRPIHNWTAGRSDDKTDREANPPRIGLVVTLTATGYISLTFRGIYDRAMEFLPRLIETGEGFKDALPYSSAAFLVGLALGLWRGEGTGNIGCVDETT